MDFQERIKAGVLESEKEGKVWKVSLIEEGPSNNTYNGYARLYPAELLEKVVDKFENVPAYMYQAGKNVLDHLPEEAQDLGQLNLNLIGFYHNPRLEEINGKTNVVADLKIHEEAKSVRKLLKEMWERGKSLGASIVAKGRVNVEAREGGQYAVMKDLQPISVDPVSNPATGARFLDLKESEVENMNLSESLMKLAEGFELDLVENIDYEGEGKVKEEEKLEVVDRISEQLSDSSEGDLLVAQFETLSKAISEGDEAKAERIMSGIRGVSEVFEEEVSEKPEEKEDKTLESLLKERSEGEIDIEALYENLNQGNVQESLSAISAAMDINDEEKGVTEKEETQEEEEENMSEKLEEKVDKVEEKLNKVIEAQKETQLEDKLEAASLPNPAERRIKEELLDTEKGNDLDEEIISETIEEKSEFVNELIESVGSQVTGVEMETVESEEEKLEESREMVNEFFENKLKV